MAIPAVLVISSSAPTLPSQKPSLQLQLEVLVAGIVQSLKSHELENDTRPEVVKLLLNQTISIFSEMIRDQKFPDITTDSFFEYLQRDIFPLSKTIVLQDKNKSGIHWAPINTESEKTQISKSAVSFLDFANKISTEENEQSREHLNALTHLSTKIVQCINIAQDVQRLSRVSSTNRTEIFYSALGDALLLEELDKRKEIFTITAHPNRALSDSQQGLVSEITNILVTNFHIQNSEKLYQKIRSLQESPVVTNVPPSQEDEISRLSKLIAQSVLPGIVAHYKEDVKARIKIFGKSVKRPTHSQQINFWPGFDMDGRQEMTPEITKFSLETCRHDASEFFINSLNEISNEIGTINGGEANKKLTSIKSKLEGAKDFWEKPPYKDENLIADLENLIAEIPQSQFDLILHLEALAYIARGQGLRTGIGELRENTTKVLSPAISELLTKAKEKFPELKENDASNLERLCTDDSLLPQIKQIVKTVNSKDSQLKRILGFLEIAHSALLQDPKSIHSFIIAQFSSKEHYLGLLLLTKIAGLNGKGAPTLPITPLSETPEDLSNIKNVINEIFSSPSIKYFLSICKNKITWMFGFSDSAMRDGFSSRELIRAAKNTVSELSTALYNVIHYDGSGPRTGRGGGFLIGVLWKGDKKTTNHVTVQGEGIYLHFGHPQEAKRTFDLSRNEWLQTITARTEIPGWKTMRYNAYALGSKAYQELIDRIVVNHENGETKISGNPDHVFTAIQEMIKVSYLDLNTAARKLYRGATPSFEDFRAVPNNILSDVTRLCWVSLYGTGAIFKFLTNDTNFETTKKALSNEGDPEFKADFGAMLLALKRSEIPLMTCLVTSMVNEKLKREERKPTEIEATLLKFLEYIESDYEMLIESLQKIKDSNASDYFTKETFNRIFETRSLKDPATNVLFGIQVAFSMMNINKEIEAKIRMICRMITVHNMLANDSSG